LKICLINAPSSAEFYDSVEFKDAGIRRATCSPQLGILSVAALTERLGCVTSVYDSNRAFFNFADSVGEAHLTEFAGVVARQIGAIDAEIYGFGSICSAYPLTLRIARLVKAIRPNAIILMGGPQASVVAGPTLRAFPFVDFILRGETEESLPIFLDELSGRGRLDRVPGLAYRSVWGIELNPSAAVIGDLDALPFPA